MNHRQVQLQSGTRQVVFLKGSKESPLTSVVLTLWDLNLVGRSEQSMETGLSSTVLGSPRLVLESWSRCISSGDNTKGLRRSEKTRPKVTRRGGKFFWEPKTVVMRSGGERRVVSDSGHRNPGYSGTYVKGHTKRNHPATLFSATPRNDMSTLCTDKTYAVPSPRPFLPLILHRQNTVRNSIRLTVLLGPPSMVVEVKYLLLSIRVSLIYWHLPSFLARP